MRSLDSYRRSCDAWRDRRRDLRVPPAAETLSGDATIQRDDCVAVRSFYAWGITVARAGRGVDSFKVYLKCARVVGGRHL